jgi:hypothetical protein
MSNCALSVLGEAKLATIEGRTFHVSCDAGTSGRLEVATDTLSISVAQRMGGTEGQMWDSVLVLCKGLEDGSATVEVIICHPQWEEPLRIATVRSLPQDRDESKSALECDLGHEPGRV